MPMPILVLAGDHPWVRDLGFQDEFNQEGELSVNLVNSQPMINRESVPVIVAG
jgi:hypothetical protein